MKIFSALVVFLLVMTVFNFLAGYLNSKVLMIGKRTKKLEEFEKNGFKISKRWDCNYMTIAVDEEKKVIACVVLGLSTKLYTIQIKDVINPHVQATGPFKNFITTVGVVFHNNENQYYFLRTLAVKKGFGVLKSSGTVKRAEKNAEDILKTIKLLKNQEEKNKNGDKSSS